MAVILLSNLLLNLMKKKGGEYEMIQTPSHQKRKRRLFDGLCNGVTYLSSGLSVFVLIAIFVFIFSKGFSSLGIDLLKGNYWSKNYLTSVETTKNHPGSFERPSSLCEEASFSSKWGIGFVDTKDQKRRCYRSGRIH